MTYTCPVHNVDFTCDLVGETDDIYMLWMHDDSPLGGHHLIIAKDSKSLR